MSLPTTHGKSRVEKLQEAYNYCIHEKNSIKVDADFFSKDTPVEIPDEVDNNTPKGWKN